MLIDIFSGWMPALVIVAAYALDMALGDPEWMPHPVRWMGRAISGFERGIRLLVSGPAALRAAGAVGAVMVVAFSWLISMLILLVSLKMSVVIFFLLAVYMAWTAISAGCLEKEALSVLSELRRGNIVRARQRLARIVGRDTAGLSEKEIMRAVVETVSENTSDGVIAPLFYLTLGGPPLALAYKAVNTLDSMVGYKSERYRDFGWFPARLDDAVNFIPARVTALLMVLAAFVLGLDWRGALICMRRDGRAHPSPNAGMPEAAVAGALGVQLGGPSTYAGVSCEKPAIGSADMEPTQSIAMASIRIMHAAAIAFVSLAVFVVVLL